MVIVHIEQNDFVLMYHPIQYMNINKIINKIIKLIYKFLMNDNFSYRST